MEGQGQILKMSEKTELTKLISKADILGIIKCSDCKQVKLPPIYQCTDGHSICQDCKLKQNKETKLKHICPICKRWCKTRNYLVEQIFLDSTHSCCYKNEGCKIEKTGKELGDHIKTCPYRSFKCPGNGNINDCHEAINLSQAREHFLADHKAVKIDSKRLDTLPFTFMNEDAAWRPSLIELDGKTFLGQMNIHKGLIYWTLFCFGTEEEARKYKVKIIFSSEKDNSTTFQWKFPVQPIIKSVGLRYANDMKDVAFPSCRFKDFKKVAVRDDAAAHYVFYTEYKISKRE